MLSECSLAELCNRKRDIAFTHMHFDFAFWYSTFKIGWKRKTFLLERLTFNKISSKDTSTLQACSMQYSVCRPTHTSDFDVYHFHSWRENGSNRSVMHGVSVFYVSLVSKKRMIRPLPLWRVYVGPRSLGTQKTKSLRIRIASDVKYHVMRNLGPLYVCLRNQKRRLDYTKISLKYLHFPSVLLNNVVWK